jgi:hypothetical protein
VRPHGRGACDFWRNQAVTTKGARNIAWSPLTQASAQEYTRQCEMLCQATKGCEWAIITGNKECLLYDNPQQLPLATAPQQGYTLFQCGQAAKGVSVVPQWGRTALEAEGAPKPYATENLGSLAHCASACSDDLNCQLATFDVDQQCSFFPRTAALNSRPKDPAGVPDVDGRTSTIVPLDRKPSH